MKILFSNSYFLNRHPNMQRQPHLYPPLGLLYVAAYVKQTAAWDVEVFDCTFSQDERDYAAALQKYRPDVVGIQSAITTRIVARNLIAIAKNVGATVVVGGPDPTASYLDYLRWGADYVAIGEGEVTMLELVSHLAHDDFQTAKATPGVAYLDGSNPIVNSPQSLIADLNLLPYPAYDLINLDQYLALWRQHLGYPELHILTSRGCPFTCTWCSRAVFGQTFRQRSVANVVQEMTYLRDTYGIERLWIADDTFGLNRQWLETWCNEVIQGGVQIPFKCMTRIDLLEPEILQKLKEAGCYQINLGVESGSQRILDAMKKRTQVSQIRAISEMIRDTGIQLGYFIMFGYSDETFTDIHKTEQLLFDINPDSIGYSVAYPVPGTEFYEGVKDRLASTNSDVLWERTMSGLQLLFRAEYPLMYYRSLVRYLENRHRYLHTRGLSINKLICLFNVIAAGSVRWIIECLWTTIGKIIPLQKGKETFCNEF